MSSVTPSTALTTCRELRKSDPLASGKWTVRSLIAINGWESVSITLARLTLQKPRPQNDKASNALSSVARREGTLAGKYLPRAHIAVRTDSPAAGAPGPAGVREFDKGFPARPQDRAPSAKDRVCMAWPAVRSLRRAPPGLKSLPPTLPRGAPAWRSPRP